MATRYWVGGAGTWNASSTTNWSATSGGASGASAPTSADDVIFDTNSGTGTIAFSGVCVCKNLTVTATQAITFGSGTLYGIYGSLSLPIGGSFSWTGVPVAFRSTTTGNTLNWGDKSTTQAVTFDGVGGAWTLASAMTTAAITVTNGSFSTNNFNVSASGLSSSNSNTRTINLGSSTVTLTGDTAVDFTNTINLTFNAGTSTILVTSSSTPTFAGGGRTFYNVSYTGGGTQTATLGGANSFNNFSVTATTAGVRGINFSANQTINGTLSVSGTTATQRVKFGSSAVGTQRTLSVASVGTLTNTNWQDIALTGAASPWTAPMSAYDLGNNTGITFDTTTLYWVGGAGDWSDSTHWSTSSGGAGGAGVPGPTNSVRIDASSGTGTQTGGSTTTPSYCKDYDSSGSSITNSSVYLVAYGSFKCRSGVTNSFVGISFYGTGTHTVDPNGSTNMSAGGGFQFRGTGTYTLMNNWVSSNAWTNYAGTFNFNGYSMSTNSFSVSGGTVNLGSSTITSTGSCTFTGSYTINAGTSTINCGTDLTNSGGTFYNFVFTSTSIGWRDLPSTTPTTFNNLTYSTPSSNGSVRVRLSSNLIINGTLTLPGSNGNRRFYFTTSNFAVKRTVTAANVALTDVDFCGIIATGAATWSGTRIGNGGLNSGITFDTPKTVYWNLPAGGDIFTAVAWATTSGGTPASTNIPLGQDTAIIEDAGLNSGATISNGTSTYYAPIPSLNFSTRTLPVTFATLGNEPTVAGNITYSSAVTRSAAQAWYVTGNITYTSAGVVDTSTFNVYGSLTLNSDSTFGSMIVPGGTINLNSYTLTSTTCTLGAASTTNFGTGKISLTGSSATIFTGNATQIVTGTPVVECTYSGSTGTRTISSSTPTEGNTISFNITAGTDTISLSSGSYVKDLNFTGFSGTSTNAVRNIYGNLTFSTGMLLSTGTGTTTFSATSGTKTITTNGKTLDFPITFNGVGGTWQLADNLTQGSTREVILTNGTVDLNAKTFTIGQFTTTAGTKNLTFNGGVLLVTASGVNAFANNVPTGFTTTAGTGTGKISLNSATAKSFKGGGATYNCTLENAGAGALTITGSNTFTTISNSVQPTSFLFTAGTTTTVTNFNISGTSGNLVTIGSDTTASHTLSKSTGEVNVSYCSISRSTATGGATWKAYTINGNVNGGNNSGWLFSDFSGNGLLFGSNF